jgi:oxygen-independent coproporphyrinogen III oxidase
MLPGVPLRHVYVHVPFCSRRCAYCDFSIAVRREVPVDEYVDGIERELRLRFGDSRFEPVETLYLGGGTPSRLGGPGIARLIRTITRVFPLQPEAEVTIEANPEDVNADVASEWRRAGVNRMSIGAQSFDDAVLSWMHRVHDGSAIGTAVGVARAAGIADISLDLIFALPPEVERDWRTDLRAALALSPTHVSLYGLTIGQATPLGRWSARGEVSEPPEERYEADFLLAHRVLAAAGFDHYEVSNFGQPGCWSRHNRAYWSGAAYAGLGPAAHEFDGVARRRWNLGPYVAWLRRLSEETDPVDEAELLTPENRIAEQVYLGLRTTAGLPLQNEEQKLVAPWVDAGWGELRGHRLVLTPMGWLRLDALARTLTLHRSR